VRCSGGKKDGEVSEQIETTQNRKSLGKGRTRGTGGTEGWGGRITKWFGARRNRAPERISNNGILEYKEQNAVDAAAQRCTSRKKKRRIPPSSHS
jgi:hypothetical protein